MQLSTSKILVSLLGSLMSIVLSLPADVHRAAGVALWFLILDLASGVAAARVRGVITSRQLRLGLKDKLVCYGVIIGFALGLSVLVGRPEWYSFAVWGVCLTEALSILENLRPILRKGGDSMMPLSRFLDTAASWIERITGAKSEALLATAPATAPLCPAQLTVPATDANGKPQEIQLTVPATGTVTSGTDAAPEAPTEGETPDAASTP